MFEIEIGLLDPVAGRLGDDSAIKVVGETLLAAERSRTLEGELLNEGRESSSRVGIADDEE